MLSTIGYEGAKLANFIQTLVAAEIEVLVDIRDRAQSRRAGFSKTALSAQLAEAGIRYVHFRELGDPKEGRVAARSGDYERFCQVYEKVLTTDEAKAALKEIAELAVNYCICLMCYERDHRQCHRAIVATKLVRKLGGKPRHLGVQAIAASKQQARRMLHPGEGATSQEQQIF